MNPYGNDDYERAARLLGAAVDSPTAKYIRDAEQQQRDMLKSIGYNALFEFQEQATGSARHVKETLAAISEFTNSQDTLNASGRNALLELQEQATGKTRQTQESIAAMSGFMGAQDMLKSIGRLDLLEEFQPGRNALVEYQRQATLEARQIKDSISAFSGLAGDRDILKTINGSDLRKQFEPLIRNVLADFVEPSRTQAELIKRSLGNLSGFETDRYIPKQLGASDYLTGLSSSIERALRTLQPTMLPVGDAFASAVLGQAQNVATLHEFEQTFAGRLITMAREVVAAPDENVKDRVEKLTKLIGGQIASSKLTTISTEAWVHIVLVVMLHLLSMHSANQSEARVLSKLQDIETQLKTVTAIHNIDKRRDLQLVAAKVLRIRAEPRADAAVVGKLTQNALVCLLDDQRYWAYVEYFDYLDGKTKEGWVSKRHLKNLPDEFIK
jgi:hypothetical protein